MSDKEKMSWETQMELNKTTGIMLGLLQNRLEELEKRYEGTSNGCSLAQQNLGEITELKKGLWEFIDFHWSLKSLKWTYDESFEEHKRLKEKLVKK